MHALHLLKPENGSRTEALQAFHWPRQSDGAQGRAGQPTVTDAAIPWAPLQTCSEDRSLPRPALFAWEAAPPASTNTVYELCLSTDRDFTEPLAGHTHLQQPGRAVLNLCIGTRSYWKVVARNRTGAVPESEVWSFTPPPATPRWIDGPGSTNVRDMGGWPLHENRSIRQGLTYRSSELDGHVEIRDEGRPVLIADLGIRTEIDLRGSHEDPKAVLDPSAVKWINIPIAPYQAIIEATHRIGNRKGCR